MRASRTVGRARPRDRRDRRPRAPVTAAGVFTTNLVAAAPVQVSRAPPRRRPRGGGRAQLRQRQRGDRRAGPARRARACASSPATGLGVATDRRARLLHRAHRHPDADGRRSRRASRSCAAQLAPTPAAARRGARRCMTTDTVPQGGRRAVESPARPRPSAAWPRARRCSRPRWPRCSRSLTTDAAVDPAPLQRALARRGRARRSTASASTAAAQHQRHRARARQRRGRQRPITDVDAAHAFTDALTEVCAIARRADGARRRGRDQVRARPRCAAPAPTPRRASRPRAVADSQLVQCSLNGGDPYWGGCSPSSARAARSSIPSGSTSPTTASPCAATASRARTTRPRSRAAMAAARHRDRLRPPRSAHGEATVLTTDLSHAYIDENRRTS